MRHMNEWVDRNVSFRSYGSRVRAEQYVDRFIRDMGEGSALDAFGDGSSVVVVERFDGRYVPVFVNCSMPGVVARAFPVWR